MKRAGARLGLLALLCGVPIVLASAGGRPTIPGSGFSARDLSGSYLPLDPILRLLADIAWVLWLYVFLAVLLRGLACVFARQGSLFAVSDHITPALLRRLIDFAIGGAFAVASLAARPTLIAIHPRSVSVALAVDPLAASARPTTEPSHSRSYTVRPGDSLWRIAERELGTGVRWREIFDLNKGRRFHDGRTFHSPRLIQPGWALELPPNGRSSRRVTAEPIRAAASPSIEPRTMDERPRPSTLAPPTSTVAQPGPARAGSAGHEHIATPAVVRFPSGVVVAGSFASGLLAAELLARLRRRRTRRIRGPQDTSDFAPAGLESALVRDLRMAGASPSAGVLDVGLEALIDVWRDHAEMPRLLAVTERDRRLEILIESDDEPPASSGGTVSPRIAFARAGDHLRADVARPYPPHLRPSRSCLERGLLVPLGRGEDGAAVHVGLLATRGLSVSGTDAGNLVTQAVLSLASVATPDELQITLLGDAFGPLEGLPHIASRSSWTEPSAALAELQTELLRRARVLLDEDSNDVWTLQSVHPEEPMPALVIVATEPPAALRGTLDALAAQAPALGGALISSGWASGHARIHVVLEQDLTLDTHLPLPKRLDPFVLDESSIQEAVRLIRSAHPEQEPASQEHPTEETSPTIEVLEAESTPLEPLEPPLPITAQPSASESTALVPLSLPEDRPAVSCLGSMQLVRDGRIPQKAVRVRAKELLAYLIAYPDGGSKEHIVDAIWPDLEQSQVDREFDRATSFIRRYARGRQDSRRYIEKQINTWRLNRGEWWVDGWEMERLVSESQRSPYAEAVFANLEQAVALYRGEFCAESYYAWAEPVRERYRTIFLQACVRLAELLTDRGDLPRALELLDRALTADPFNEEVVRFAIKLEASLGRRAAALERYRIFSKTLRENLDVDPDPQTQTLVRQITHGKMTPVGGSRESSSA